MLYFLSLSYRDFNRNRHHIDKTMTDKKCLEISVRKLYKYLVLCYFYLFSLLQLLFLWFMVWLLSTLLVWILSYSIALGIIVYAIPVLGVQIISTNPIAALLLMGIVLWILFALIKWIIWWILLPFNILTLWAFAFIINIAITVLLLYVFYWIIWLYGPEFNTQLVLWSFIQNLAVSIILSIISMVIKKII